jgi:integrase
MLDNKAKITRRVANAASPPPEGYYHIWDTELKGFRLRVRASGAKTFEFAYRVEGQRQRLLTIGHFPAFTPDQARKAAEEAKYHVGQGRDPQEEKSKARRACTVAELAEAYLSEGRIDKPTKRESSWKTDETYFRCHIIPLLGARAARSLRTDDIMRWQADVVAGKTATIRKLGFRRKSVVRGGKGAATRATRAFGAMLNWAVKRDLLDNNPVSKVPKYRDGQRERFLTDQEAVRLFQTLATMEEDGEVRAIHADLFRLIALTGARLSEIRELAWSEIDFLHHLILLTPDRHKTGRTGRKAINLNSEALAILERRRNDTQWVFPKASPYDGPIEPPRRCWNALTERAECSGLRIHDLRHTFASLLFRDGHSLAFVQKALGHSRPEVTARYAHLKDEATRAAFDHVGRIYSGATSRPRHVDNHVSDAMDVLASALS